MRYVGSKNKLSRELVPIIQSYITDDTKGYLEPFVGGGNVIDKIKHNNRIGCDIHEELIELLKHAQENVSDIPDCILDTEYVRVRDNKDDYEKWYVGLVGFCASFSAKYFGGYARNSKDDITGKWTQGAIKNLKKQAPNLKNIRFINTSFSVLPKDKIKNHVIYCDIPYKGTTKYKTEKFNYEKFYDWCVEMSKDNVVLISEYSMPEDNFECIWSKEVKANFDSNRISGDIKNIRVEKLFKVK